MVALLCSADAHRSGVPGWQQLANSASLVTSVIRGMLGAVWMVYGAADLVSCVSDGVHGGFTAVPRWHAPQRCTRLLAASRACYVGWERPLDVLSHSNIYYIRPMQGGMRFSCAAAWCTAAQRLPRMAAVGALDRTCSHGQLVASLHCTAGQG